MALTAAERAKRYRDGKRLENVTNPGRDAPSVTQTPEGPAARVPANYGQADCQCQMCRHYRAKGKDVALLNHGAYRPQAELGRDERNRISLPGDVDYEETPFSEGGGAVGQGGVSSSSVPPNPSPLSDLAER